MKSRKTTLSCRWLPGIQAACFCLLIPVLSHAQVVWDNGNGNNRWNTNANWNPNGRPDLTSNVQFNATDNNATVNDIQLRGNRDANSLTFNDVDDNFSLVNGNGSRTLTLTSGDITRTAGSSGNQGLEFTTLALGGNATMNINGSGSLTINSNIVNNGGTRSLTKSGGGELILTGSNTYSGGTNLMAGTLTLQSISALGSGSDLTMSGGTLFLGTASTSITNLNITGSSTIDFGGTGATLSIGTLTLSSTASLTILNWTAAADFFYATNWANGGSGPGVYDEAGMGIAPMNQITFSGVAAANRTGWDSLDSQIRPNVPEPSTYGMLFMISATVLVWVRKRFSHRAI